LLIILASFYHSVLADIFGLSIAAEERFFSLGIFWAAATGGYGVVMVVFGFLLSGNAHDTGVRLLPVFFLIVISVLLYFFLLTSSFKEPYKPERLRPSDTITI